MIWTYQQDESFYLIKRLGKFEAMVVTEQNAQIFCEMMEWAEKFKDVPMAMIDSDNKVVQLPVKWRGK